MDRTWTEETPKGAAAQSLVVDATRALDGALGPCGASPLGEATCAFLDIFTFSIDDWSGLHAVTELMGDDTKPGCSESSRPVAEEHQKSKSAPTEARDSSKPAPAHTKKKNPFAWAEKKPRKRAKVEILKLRGEVAELQTHLARLQATASCKPHDDATIHDVQFDTSSRTLTSLSLATKTLNEAATELQMLQRSQELNGLLRSALIEETQVREAFEAQLQQHAMFETYNFELLNEFSSIAADSKDREYRDSPRGELEKLLGDLERQHRSRVMDRVLREICPPASTISSSRNSSRSAITSSDAVCEPAIKRGFELSDTWEF